MTHPDSSNLTLSTSFIRSLPGARRLNVAQELAALYPGVGAISVDVTDEASLDAAVAGNHVVISLIPYIHHGNVFKSAIKNKVNVVTTSYVSPTMMGYDEA